MDLERISLRALIAGAALTAAVPVMSQQKLDTCYACHGQNGISGLALTPSLAAQPSAYVVAQLALFRSGQRKNELMAPMAKTLAKDDLRSVAEAIEKLPAPPPSPGPIDASRYARGKAVVAREHCDSCHQPDFSGIDTAPRLAHQRGDYLQKALTDFKKGVRSGYGTPIMPGVAAAISEAEIADVAHYLAHWRP